MTTFEPVGAALTTRAASRLSARRGQHRKRRRRRLLFATVAVAFAVAGAGFGLITWSQQKTVAAETATIRVSSSPAGAAIQVDGHDRGRAPVSVAVSPGSHRLVLRLAGYTPVDLTVRLATTESVDVQRQLWLSSPNVQLLRPPLPGAPIAGVDFLQDGRLLITVQLPGGQQQLWISDPANGRADPLAPVAAERLVAKQDGSSIAYLARTKTNDSTVGELNEVWITDTAGGVPRRIFGLTAAGADQRLTDLTWAPDGRHLLLVIQQSLAAGGNQTQLLWLATADGSSRALMNFPAVPVAGSYVWRSDGEAVAFLARAGGVVSLSSLAIPSAQFRYLADIEQTDGTPLPFAPLAWGPNEQFSYSASPPLQPGQQVWLPMSRSDPLLFLARPGDPNVKPLGATRAVSPAWRSDGSLVAFTRPKRDGSLALARITASASTDSLTPIGIKPSGFVARWDMAHAQAVIASHDQANGVDRLSYWLVRFREEPS